MLETAHKLVGNTWGDEGTTREQRAWTADPDLIRRLEVGQACYIQRRRGHLRAGRPAQASPLTLLPARRRRPGGRCPSPAANPTPAAWPQPASLDDVFGPGTPDEP